ncbi:SRPBCC family protein [Maritimibacter sp. DP1N21-5]|uniref:SRPBCC family protein n=1 Tax=Maritimibacter sp. DP1N21-5 TaxID=2836867 RepID=UPI001C483ED3|nr:SRPBCC family protein [Maritimibacter sp. DP1N21-5]MBV7409531.1 SRPBCC family protein [Maritimibacter sp. DP1N21-5]
MAKTLDTTSDRVSDTELVTRRTFAAPARVVFEAWTRPEHMLRWWAPASFGITFISCKMDVRTGGGYRFEFGHPDFDGPMAFHGTYLEVIPDKRLVWTNAETEEGSVTTVTFEEENGRTHLTVHDRYPSKEALDDAIASGSTGAFPEQFAALDDYLAGQPA